MAIEWCGRHCAISASSSRRCRQQPPNPKESQYASSCSHERRRRFRRCRSPRRRGGARRRRRPPRAVPDARHPAHRQPRLLHHRGLPRRLAGLRRAGNPVLRVGLLGAVQGGRGPGLHRRIRRRTHPEPLHALQRADQVRRAAGEGHRPGIRRRLHRPLRQGDQRRRRQPRAAPRRGLGQGPELRPGRADPRAAQALHVPARGHPVQGRGPRGGGTPRPVRGQQAGQP